MCRACEHASPAEPGDLGCLQTGPVLAWWGGGMPPPMGEACALPQLLLHRHQRTLMLVVWMPCWTADGHRDGMMRQVHVSTHYCMTGWR